MAHINLLPWRDELRQERKKSFAIAAAVSAGIGLLVVAAGWYTMNTSIEFQKNRNRFLQAEMALLDTRIKEIEQLEKVKSQLLARMDVIESLQDSRKQPVHYFNELVTSLPEGVFLQSALQKGDSVTVKGKAQSNARVSEYMRRLEESPWFSSPALVVITTRKAGKVRTSEFQLKFKVNRKPLTGEEGEEEGDES